MDAYEWLRTIPFPSLVDAFSGGIERFKTRKNGDEWYGPCLVHAPKRNATSFSYHRDGRFACFSCGAKGRGAIDLTMAIRKVGFQEAVSVLEAFGQNSTALAPRRQLGAPGGVSHQLSSENPPFKSTYEKFAVRSAWLKERGLTEDTLKRYEVFEYNNPARRSAHSGSVMLKIRRYSDGECVGYLSRNVGEVTPEKPKYVFPKGFQKSLEVFGAVQLKNEKALRLAYLVESPLCVLKFHQLGLPCVSCFGWSVSEQQAAILARLAKGYIYLPDLDKRKEAVSVAGFLSEFVWTKMPKLPEGVSDPEQLSDVQIRQLTA